MKYYRYQQRMTNSSNACHTVDAIGLLCPLPVLKARKALLALPQGAMLTVLSDDPVARIDIPHFCQEMGYELTESAPHGDAYRFVIKRS